VYGLFATGLICGLGVVVLGATSATSVSAPSVVVPPVAALADTGASTAHSGHNTVVGNNTVVGDADHHQELLKKKPKPKKKPKKKAPAPAPAAQPQPYAIPAPGVGTSQGGTRPSRGPIQRPSGDTTGNFRVVCNYSHMNYDDAIVYPGKVGAAHMHTYFGNLNANANSTGASLLASGNSTCDGGILNRSAYWTPSIIDGNGVALIPEYNMIYYKSGYQGVSPQQIVTELPNGLKMLAGDMKATKSQGAQWYERPVNWRCDVEGWPWQQPSIPDCPAGGHIVAEVQFPQCWDGKNLDSPNHQSHVAYGKYGVGCPATHPVALPSISYNVYYTVPAGGPLKWRLSSDMYSGGPGGFSLHADLIMAWDPNTSKQWLNNCVRQNADCNVSQISDTTGLMVGVK
jgi:hypothetical protein